MTADALLEAPTIWALVQERARLSGDRPMLLDTDGGRVTFAEVAARAERVAAGLQALGVEPGATVTWQLPTRIDTVLVSLALARLGVVQNPVLHLYREREVAAVLRQSRPDFYLVPGVWRDRDFATMAKSLTAELPETTVVDLGLGLPDGDPDGLPAPPDNRHRRALGLLHLRYDVRAQGRAAQRPDVDGRRPRPCCRARHVGGRHRLDRVPLLAHRRPRLPADDAGRRIRRGAGRSIRAGGRSCCLPLARCDHVRWQHGVLSNVPGRATQVAGGQGHPDVAVDVGWWCAQAAGAVLRRAARDGCPSRARLRHDRDPDDCDGVAARHRRAAGHHRGHARCSAPRCAS